MKKPYIESYAETKDMGDLESSEFELTMNIRFKARSESEAIEYKHDLAKYAEDKRYIEVLEITSDIN